MFSNRILSRSALLAVLVLVSAACGGDSDGVRPEGAAPTEGGDTSNNTPSAETAPSANGGRGSVTIDGTTMNFRMHDIVHSQIEGMDDLTFESCSPSFFGAGFNVIGYAVDDTDTLILDDDGGIAGTLRFLIPLTPEDEPTTGPPEFELVFESQGFDHDMVPSEREADLNAGSSSTWTVNGTTISGSLVLANVVSEAVIADFEVTCS